MKDKDPNKIAAIEQAIAKKYGEETIQNPLAAWNEDKEKEYLRQMKELYSKSLKIEVHQEKIDINGIKVCLLKFDCCNNCYIQHIEGREKRWQEGWRPNLKEENK